MHSVLQKASQDLGVEDLPQPLQAEHEPLHPRVDATRPVDVLVGLVQDGATVAGDFHNHPA